MSKPGAVLLVDPVNRVYEHDALFDPAAGAFGGDDVNGPWRHVRERLAARGVPVHTADLFERGEAPAAERYVYVSMGCRTRYVRLAARDEVAATAFFALECPIVEPRLYLELDRLDEVFARLYSFSDAESLRPFLRRPLEFRHFHIPQPFDRVHEDAWSWRERSFLTIINANKVPRLTAHELYSERLRAVEYFERFGEIDLWGVGWDGPPYQMGETRVPGTVQRLERAMRTRWERYRPPRDPLRAAARSAYRGPTGSKAETLSRYTFAICFENMVLRGWITEKLFDCLLAGTVPIYLGAPDIERWVAPECFVDMRSFAGYDELRAYLHDLSPTEVAAMREAGREYLRSEQFRPFTKHAFAEIFEQLVAEDAGIVA